MDHPGVDHYDCTEAFADSIYTIENVNAKGKFLNGDSQSNGASIHLWENPESTSSQWPVAKVAPRVQEAPVLHPDLQCPATSLKRHRKEPKGGGHDTLFCWMLVKPVAAEIKLLAAQLCLNTSIFRCDEHMLFSNISLRTQLASLPGSASLSEVVIEQSLDTAYGGPWNTALNTDLFIKIWSTLFSMGLHLRQEWVVKLDADTVFLPSRLGPVLQKIGPPAARHAPLYVNSCSWCDIKLIGPIEVFNRASLQALERSLERCRAEVDYHDVSEDVFLERCFGLLGIKPFSPSRQDKLLQPTWHVRNHQLKRCSENWAAVHPFKDTEKLVRCYELSYGVK